MSAVAMRMRRGWFRDPEDFHGTYRMEGALRILKAWGAEPTFRKHDEQCDRHPDRLSNVVFGYRERVICSCGADQAQVEWPEWVTDECFDAAYRAANVLQTERGAYHQREAERLKRERVEAARER